MSIIYAIGDIHGCAATFRKMLACIQMKKSDKMYLLGDYIDRGNDSKGVIDIILNMRKRGCHIHTLRGNHEQMLLEAYNEESKIPQWFKNGGEATLQSFGITDIKKLPKKYLDFFQRTKYFIATNKFIFIRAGLNFRLDNPFLDKKAMLWSREEYFDYEKINYRILIHGHTPIPFEKIVKPPNDYKINIDGGCVHNHKPFLGNLVAIVLPGKKYICIPNIE